VETSQLRFNHNALETKLKKFASHCQRLEDEKDVILRVLKSTQRDSVIDNDISKAVVRLCDRVASLEEECEALSKKGSSGSSLLPDVEKLRIENAELRSKVTELKRKYEKHLKSEIELKEQVSSLRSDQDSVADQKLDEYRRRVSFLEQENLQLMHDLKALKKKLSHAKAEVNMLKIKGTEDDTLDSSKLASSEPSLQKSSRATRTPANKENASNRNVVNPHAKTRAQPLSAKKTRAPGLGERPTGNEEEGECKQS
jgi:predicted RNase H-like nuclease (RuvC/YqgF family)